MFLLSDVTTSLAGLVVGLVLGLVGGGGSIIAVPLLLYGVGMTSVHAAIGTSAVAVAISAFGNLLNVARKKLVKWPCALVFSAAGIAGSLAGSHAALQVSGAKLLHLFGGLMIVVGAMMLLRRNVVGDSAVKLSMSNAKLMAPWIIGSGLAVGLLAGFFGIGGGFLIVPGLMFATGMTITSAIATSLVGVTAFGLVSATTYVLAGEMVWRSVGFFVGGAVLGSAIGQWLSTFMEARKNLLQSIFATFVMALGFYTVVKGAP